MLTWNFFESYVKEYRPLILPFSLCYLRIKVESKGEKTYGKNYIAGSVLGAIHKGRLRQGWKGGFINPDKLGHREGGVLFNNPDVRVKKQEQKTTIIVSLILII